MIINQIAQGGGSAKKYNLLDRVKDDSNNEIGTVCGFIKDSNDTEYAVVCLDAQYRTDVNAYTEWAVNKTASVTNLSEHPNPTAWDNTETATENCTKILAFTNSVPVSNCRANSFIIDGQTYQGQLPVVKELAFVAMHMTSINTLDPTATTYPNRIIGAVYSWSSTQYSNSSAWYWSATYGDMASKTKLSSTGSIPILELPNA